MERLVAWYRITSAYEPVVSLVIANLVPLVGVIAWGWDLWTLLALYWAENGVIGAYNVLKILLARGESGGPLALAGVSRVATAAFFSVHYGIFWLVHGIFVLFALPMFAGLPSLVTDGFSYDVAPIGGILARMDLVGLGLIGMVISHGISFWFNYIRRGEFRRATPARLMAAPYARVVVLHLTIIFGAFISMGFGTPIGALLVLVVLKTVLDLALHNREHRALGAG